MVMQTRLAPGSSYATVTKRFQVADFTLSETSYPSQFHTPDHSHEQAFLYTVLDGDYTESIGRAALTPDPFTLLFRPAGETHSHHTYSRGRCFNLDLAPSWLDRLAEYSVSFHQVAEFRGGRLSWLSRRLYGEFRNPDFVAPLAMEALILELLVEISRCSGRPAERQPPRWLQQVVDLLHTEFAETLRLDDMATRVGVHPVHLARVFRRYRHCTVGDYLRKVRVEFACHQLLGSNTPLAEIALAAGFGDQSQFCRIFKRLMGQTPGEFRDCSSQVKIHQQRLS
jgi:AraC family transcriptional regulator